MPGDKGTFGKESGGGTHLLWRKNQRPPVGRPGLRGEFGVRFRNRNPMKGGVPGKLPEWVFL